MNIVKKTIFLVLEFFLIYKTESIVECEWGRWNTWGSCSVPCGGGIRVRTRSKLFSDVTYSLPPPQFHGKIPKIALIGSKKDGEWTLRTEPGNYKPSECVGATQEIQPCRSQCCLTTNCKLAFVLLFYLKP